MKRPFEVADIVTSHLAPFLKKHPQNLQVIKTLQAIKDCRTAALGGHRMVCDCCGKERYQYHSCRNRHCPKCQAVNREKWIWSREAELLPVSYFHVVFTLPAVLNELALPYPREVYNSLFRSAWQTIHSFSQDPKHLGAQTGMTSVLHTWGQNLSLHPHLHCIIPGGGLTPSGCWRSARNKGKYLFPTQALAKVFRARFMSELRLLGVPIGQSIAKSCFSKPWVVYAKAPFAGPKQVIEYLGRYTHKIAISNHRIKRIDREGNVHFSWKNYRNAGKTGIMCISAIEFLRRFSQHILPSGFVRIRHYGMLSSRKKSTQLNRAREYFRMNSWQKPDLQDWKRVALVRLDYDPDLCPHCKKGTMVIVEQLQPLRGPPHVSRPMELSPISHAS